MTLPQTVCHCLYCGMRTGRTPLQACGPEKLTICSNCVWRIDRDETREIAAGMTPWTRGNGKPQPALALVEKLPEPWEEK